MLETYDPDHAPDPREWLALDEADRIDLVTEWHEASDEPLPDAGDWVLHSVIHVIVENQAAENACGVRDKIERLVGEGLDRHDAIHAVGSVVAEHMHEVIAGGGDTAMDQEAYARELSELTAAGWRASADEEPAPASGPGPGAAVEPFSDEQRAVLEAFLDERGEDEFGYAETAGFLYAVLCAPDFVRPSEWQPIVLGETPLADMEQAQDVIGALMSLYNWISGRINEGGSPLPPGCEPDPDPMANFEADAGFGRWARGFAQGHGWLEESWTGPGFEAVDEELGAVMMVLSYFGSRQVAEALREEMSSNTRVEEMAADMLDLVPDALHGYADIGRNTPNDFPARPQAPARSHKVGRNEPCPCGSGKKYKKCCGRGD